MPGHYRWFFHTVTWSVRLLLFQNKAVYFCLITLNNIFILFLKCDLFELRNVHTNFRRILPSGCRVMWYRLDLSGHWLQVRIFTRFFWFFFWNVIYSSYTMPIQTFEGFCPVVAELWVIGWILWVIDYRYEFLLVFLDFFFKCNVI